MFSTLEDQLCSFTPDMPRKGGSPDRADALVWGLSELMVEVMPGWGILEHYRREAEGLSASGGDHNSDDPWVAARIFAPKKEDSAPRVRLRAPAGVNTVYGANTGHRYLADEHGVIEMMVADADAVRSWERLTA
jgi:hypothetical protein